MTDTTPPARLCDQPRGLAVPPAAGERRTHWVLVLTGLMMVVEIGGGVLTGSMALLADGWHMGTHLVALALTALAYWYARRHADTQRFTFGTGKVGSLGGFASAVFLALVAALMAVESLQRLLAPEPIRFDEATAVAALGLAVNLASALLLRDVDHHHAHPGDAHLPEAHLHVARRPGAHPPDGQPPDGHGHAHPQDHNLRAAYIHVIADALTSVTALVALLAGRQLGWIWLDPLMGVAGSLVVTKWAVGLLRDTARVLLDAEDHGQVVARLRAAIEEDGPHRVGDLHVWRIAPGRLAAVARVTTPNAADAAHFRALLQACCPLAHVTVEVSATPVACCPRSDHPAPATGQQATRADG